MSKPNYEKLLESLIENLKTFVNEEDTKILREISPEECGHFEVSDDFHPWNLPKMGIYTIEKEILRPCGMCSQYKRAAKELTEYWTDSDGDFGITKHHFLCEECYEKEYYKTKYTHPDER